MKHLFSILALSVITLVAGPGVLGQCTISDVSVTNVIVSGSTASFDMSFKHIRNGGNKWVTIHMWSQSSYPNYNYNQPPTTTRLSGQVPFGTIVINNSNIFATGTYTAAQAFASTYQADGAFAISTSGSSTLAYNSLTGVYTISGLSVILPAGTTVIEADVWSSQSSNNQVVHCFNKGIFPIVSGQLPVVNGTTNCGTPSVIVSAGNPNPVIVSGSYQVFADANGSGTLDVSDPSIYSSGSISIPASGTYISAPITFSTSYKYKDLYVIMNVGGFSLAAVAKVNACPMSLPATGLGSFKMDVIDSKALFTWTALTEINIDYYKVERQWIGDSTWYTAGIISSKNPGGNSTMPTSYSLGISIQPMKYGMLWLGLFLIVSLIIGRLLPVNLRIVCMVCLLTYGSMSVFSCRKSTIKNEDEMFTSGAWYRLTPVDRDGSQEYHSPARLYNP